MLIRDIVLEHSDWAQLNYTERELHNLHQASRAIQVGFLKRGVKIRFDKHFFDQMKLERGIKKKYTPEVLMMTFGHIMKVIDQTFAQDPAGDYVFYDPDTKINVVMLQDYDGTYVARTTIRAEKYIGPGHKVTVWY